MASVEMSTSYPVVLRLLNSSAWRERASGQRTIDDAHALVRRLLHLLLQRVYALAAEGDEAVAALDLLQVRERLVGHGQWLQPRVRAVHFSPQRKRCR